MTKRTATLISSIAIVIIIVVVGSLGLSLILNTFLTGTTFNIANLSLSILWGAFVGNRFAHWFLIKRGYLN